MLIEKNHDSHIVYLKPAQDCVGEFFCCPGRQRTAQAVSGGEEDYPLILIEEGLSSSLLPISLRASEGNYMSDFQRQSVDSLKIQQALAGELMCLDASK